MSLVVLLAGCATQGVGSATGGEDELAWKGGGLEYALTRPEPAESAPDGFAIADLTLVELDAEFAERLLGISGHNDISPRAYADAMGEIAAVNACYGHGRLITRPSVQLQYGVATGWSWNAEQPYLQDWEIDEGNASPVFAAVTEGVEGTIKLQRGKEGVSVAVDFSSAQIVRPLRGFTTSLATGTSVKIQIPELVIQQRVATESLRPNETAMFQLGRAAHNDTTRIRLLFVRVRGDD